MSFKVTTARVRLPLSQMKLKLSEV